MCGDVLTDQYLWLTLALFPPKNRVTLPCSWPLGDLFGTTRGSRFVAFRRATWMQNTYRQSEPCGELMNRQLGVIGNLFSRSTSVTGTATGYSLFLRRGGNLADECGWRCRIWIVLWLKADVVLLNKRSRFLVLQIH